MEESSDQLIESISQEAASPLPVEQQESQPVPQEQAQEQEATAPAEAPETAPLGAPETATETVPTQTNEAPTETSDTYDDIQIDTLPYAQQAPTQPFDWNNLPQDADGNVDPNAFASAINQQITQATETARQEARKEAQEQIREQKLWEQAENAHPELKEDKEIRDMVKNARWGEWVATNGQKNPTPKQIADKLFNKIGAAKKQGVDLAQNNVRIQETAVLETASNTGNAAPQSELRTRISTASTRQQQESATNDLLRNLIDTGDIKIGE